MKKLLYLFLVIPLIFSSCAKEEGCMDTQATNYNADAEKEDESCTYSLTGCWEWETGTVDGNNAFSTFTDVVLYCWDNGQFGVEYYIPSGLYAYDIGTYSLSADQTTVNTSTETFVWDDNTQTWQFFGTSNTLLNVSKFNSNEFDAGWNDNEGIGVFTSNKSTTYTLGGWKK